MFPFDEFLSDYQEIHASVMGFFDGFSVTFPPNFHECPEDICPKGDDRWYYDGFQIVGWVAKWCVYVVLVRYGILNIDKILPVVGL